jgi:hypothetical protein
MEIISCTWNYEKKRKGKMVVRKGLILKSDICPGLKIFLILHPSFFMLHFSILGY